MSKKSKILLIVPYPLSRAPSQRFRVELFFRSLCNSGMSYDVLPFLDDSTFAILYGNSSYLKRGWGVLKGYWKRLTALFTLHRYDYIFIHREATPLGPPFFEFLAAKVFRKKMIYDFDDAIWIADSKSKILNWWKAYWKIALICKWAYKVVAGNDFLCDFARRFNKNVVLIPTCVDTENVHNRIKDQEEQPITIGWTGSHTTLRFLDPIVPILKSFAEKCGIRTVVICNRPPAFSFPGLTYVPWNAACEIDDLLEIHVGIMPLQNDLWSKGKCGFKLIQYLSLGIPAVASPVGVNINIIENGVTGFLCDSDEEWEQAFTKLINDVQLRKIMGEYGRRKMVVEYSIHAYEKEFVALFS
jgi:glycosyltransferase involved in cell wall biosynthesis